MGSLRIWDCPECGSRHRGFTADACRRCGHTDGQSVELAELMRETSTVDAERHQREKPPVVPIVGRERQQSLFIGRDDLPGQCYLFGINPR